MIDLYYATYLLVDLILAFVDIGMIPERRIEKYW